MLFWRFIGLIGLMGFVGFGVSDVGFFEVVGLPWSGVVFIIGH